MKPSIITISRQHGSGGREIGARLSKQLGIPCYDKLLFYEAAQRSNIHESFFETAEADHKNWIFSHVFDSPLVFPFLPLNEQIFITQSNTIRDLAQKGPCIIVGRGANKILKDREDVLNIFIHADLKIRKQRISEEYQVGPEEAEKKIQIVDKDRSIYLKTYTDQVFGRADNYHLSIDSGKIGIDYTAKIILSVYSTLK